MKPSDAVISKHFFSNGKLLLSGEYLVVKGAQALAVPLKPGQEMTVNSFEDKTGAISWKSYVNNEPWFEAVFSVNDLQILESGDQKKAENLRKILQAAHRLNSSVLVENRCFNVKTNLGFSPEWGFGSSSTLLSNIAHWFNINAFDLHFLVSEGSGYDVACARANGPIIYRLEGKNPTIKPASFYPDFHQHLYFVYLGKKQESAQSLKSFLPVLDNRHTEIETISAITQMMISAGNLSVFEEAMVEHEALMSVLLKMPTAQELFFPDFDGKVKSLGAWGGDFVMVTWKHDKQTFEKEMKMRGFHTFFSFDEVVLEHDKTL